MKERKVIDYEKAVKYLEERRKHCIMSHQRHVKDNNVTVYEYAETLAKWSVYDDLIQELSKVPF